MSQAGSSNGGDTYSDGQGHNKDGKRTHGNQEGFNVDELFLEEFEELNNTRGKVAAAEADK